MKRSPYPTGLTIAFDPKSVDAEIRNRLLVVARALAKEIRKRIRQQVYDWPDLSDRYLQWKREQGLDTRMLIAYGYYINSIDAWETKRGIKIGIRRGNHPISQVSMRMLGRWLEYGTYNKDGSLRMPPRPHWRPTILWWKNNKYKEERQSIRKMIRQQKTKVMRERLRKQLRSAIARY